MLPLALSLPLAPWTTAVGVLWTGITVVLLYRGKDGPFRSGWVCLVNAVLLAVALRYVTRAIAGVEALAGGQRILDTRYPYTPSEVLAFAAALGDSGRAAYAAFQLGYDTWAPPAIAGFVGSVACATLPAQSTRLARLPIWAYLVSVLLANALMPVVMLNYPALDAPWLRGLLHLVPLLDFAKYTLHLISWLGIVAGWLWLWHARRRARATGS